MSIVLGFWLEGEIQGHLIVEIHCLSATDYCCIGTPMVMIRERTSWGCRLSSFRRLQYGNA